MQYHLDTIPVWEAMEQKADCPLCALRQRTEQEEIERTLGSGVMEPDVRIHFNERGVCKAHQQMLFARQNRLGHALLMDSHVKEQLEHLQKLRRQLSDSDKPRRAWLTGNGDSAALAEALQALASRCVVCDRLDEHMARYRYTFLHLWKTSKEFQAAWAQSQGVCLPHAAELISDASSQLNRAQQTGFSSQTLQHLTERLTEDEKDLDWFTRKFDYRNQAEPWGNSKTALERVVNRLRGRCLGDGNPTAGK